MDRVYKQVVYKMNPSKQQKMLNFLSNKKCKLEVSFYFTPFRSLKLRKCIISSVGYFVELRCPHILLMATTLERKQALLT